MVAASLWQAKSGIILPSRIIDIPATLIINPGTMHKNARTKRANWRTTIRSWRQSELIPLTRPSLVFHKPLSRVLR